MLEIFAAICLGFGVYGFFAGSTRRSNPETYAVTIEELKAKKSKTKAPSAPSAESIEASRSSGTVLMILGPIMMVIGGYSIWYIHFRN